MKAKWGLPLTLFGCVVWAGEALAYIGPGAGITVIGSALALLGAIVLLIVGFAWYPIKRWREARARRRDRREDATR